MADSGLDKFVTGMVFGAALGAAIGLLLAPKPGSETRQMVRERAGEYIDVARDRAGEYAGPVRERAGEVIGSARERVANVRRRRNEADELAPEPLLEDE
jgi:gas vesicle protein